MKMIHLAIRNHQSRTSLLVGNGWVQEEEEEEDLAVVWWHAMPVMICNYFFLLENFQYHYLITQIAYQLTSQSIHMINLINFLYDLIGFYFF